MSGLGNTVKKGLIGLLGSASLLCAMGQPAFAETPDDFDGVWMVEKPSQVLKTSDGKAPPLLAEGLALYQERSAQAKKGDYSFDEVVTKCAMPGLARIHAMPYAFQILTNENRVAFVYEYNHNFRSADITSLEPVADWETSYGKSSASFSGDEMVLKTTGVMSDAFLDAAGMPHSDAMVVTETYSLKRKGDRLTLTLKFEDPTVFSEAWEASFTFRRMENYHIREDVCLDRLADGEVVIDWDRSQG